MPVAALILTALEIVSAGLMLGAAEKHASSPSRWRGSIYPDPGHSAQLKGPRTFLRIRPGIFDFGPDLGLKLGQTKPKIPGTVPTDRHTSIPNDSGSISARFDNGPKLLSGETAQPSTLSWSIEVPA